MAFSLSFKVIKNLDVKLKRKFLSKKLIPSTFCANIHLFSSIRIIILHAIL